MKPTTPGRGERGPATSSTLLPPAAVCPRPVPAQRRPKGGGLRRPRSAQRARVTRLPPAGKALRVTAGLRWERRGTPGPGRLRGRPRLSRPPLPGAGAPASLPPSIILGRLKVCRSLLVVAVNHSVRPSSIGVKQNHPMQETAVSGIILGFTRRRQWAESDLGLAVLARRLKATPRAEEGALGALLPCL